MQNNGKAAKRTGLALLGGAALAAFFAPSALAQTTPGAEPQDDIIVTATRRPERIQDVPYNITAVTGEQIEASRMRDSTELLRSIPGVSVVDRGERNSATVNGVRLRGLNVDSAALGDYAVSAVATVSTYVNDTPIFANFLLNDLAQVEVLRGPQGTLYGSGSLGGNVRYVMNQPVLGEFGGHAQGSASQVNGSDSVGFGGDLTLNVPIGDRMAIRASVARADYPGITDYVNLYVLDADGVPVAPSGVLSDDASYRSQENADTVDIWFGRFSVLVKPTDNFDVTLNYFTQSDNIGGRRGQALGSDGFGRPYGEYESGSVQLEPSYRDLNIISLEANMDFGFATLTSSSSYYEQTGGSVSENTGFYAQAGFLPFYYNFPRPMASAVRQFGDQSFVEELRLVSDDGGNFDYVLGLYYQDQTRSAAQQSYLRGFQTWYNAAIGLPLVISDNDFLYNTVEDFNSTAIFGELTWHVNDRLDVTGGFRTFDNTSESNSFFQVGLYTFYNLSNTKRFETNENDTLFRLNAAYDLDADNLLYATISEGYRRGGSNPLPTSGNFSEVGNDLRETYAPDTVTNYEVGVKGRLMDVRYDLNAFYIDWQDAQLNTATPQYGFFFVANAGAAHTAGIELQLAGDLTEHLSYNFGYTYLDATLDQDFCDPGSPVCTSANAFDLSGRRLPGAPEHAINLSLDYARPIGNYLFDARLDASYQSETRNATSQSPRFDVDLPGFAIFNATTTLSRDNWDFSLWVKNIANEEGVTGTYTEAYMGTQPSQGYFGNGSKDLISLPRTFGATLGVRF